MSDLSNATAKYVISIQTEGSAAPAAADIKKVGEEVTKTTAVIKQAEQAMQGHTAALGGNRMAYMELGHVARSSADALAIGINPVRVLAMETPRVVQAMSMLGISLTAIGTGMLAFTPLVVTGAVALQTWRASVSEAESEAALFAATQSNIARNFNALNDALGKRLINPADWEFITKLLSIGTPSALRSAQARLSELGISGEQISNYEKLRKLEDDMHRATMDHFDAERSKAHEVYEQRLIDIGNLKGSGGLTAQEGSKAEQGAMTEYNSKLAGVQGAEQSKAYAEAVKQIDDDLFQYENMLGQKRQLSAEQENTFKVEAMHKLAQQEKISADDFTTYVMTQQHQLVAAQASVEKEKESALKAAATVQKQLGDLENRVELENLTGEARKVRAIDQTTAALIKQYRELATQLGLSQAAVDNFNAKARAGAELQKKAVDDSALHIKQWQQMADSAAQSFASGMANALVSFADGTKSAEEAFGQFAASFLTQIAEMIIQQEILNAIKSASSYFGSGGTATANATGGVHYAANGIQSVSSATYFPKFNVVAGEAGMEMLTVLAKPTFRSIGGMDAVVGNAGNRRLAITNASDLENSGGGSAGGVIHIRIEHTPETQANIVSNSIKGAVTEVTKQMKRNSAISSAVKGLTA